MEGPESWVSRPGTNTQTPHCPQTPLTSSEESLDFSVSLEQVRVQRGGAGRGPPNTWTQGLSQLAVCPSSRPPRSGCSGQESSCIDTSWPTAPTSSETESTTSGSTGERERRPWLPPRPPPRHPQQFSLLFTLSRLWTQPCC